MTCSLDGPLANGASRATPAAAAAAGAFLPFSGHSLRSSSIGLFRGLQRREVLPPLQSTGGGGGAGGSDGGSSGGGGGGGGGGDGSSGDGNEEEKVLSFKEVSTSLHGGCGCWPMQTCRASPMAS